MPTEFTLPELGENITSGDVVRVLVKPGDVIQKDQAVVELETDKATIEVPSSVAGKVADVKVKQGEKVKVGQTILTVEEAGGQPSPSERPATAASASREADRSATKEARPAAAASAPKPPPEGAAEEGGMSQRAQAQAAEAQKGQEAQKSAQRQPETAQSSKGEWEVEEEVEEEEEEEEEEEQEEEPAQTVETAEQASAPQKPRRAEVVEMRASRPAPEPSPKAEAPSGPPVPAAPSVRRLARELGVDVARVQGSGPGGRIGPEDVKAVVRSAAGRRAEVAAEPPPDFSRWGEIERKPMSGVRRKTAEHLTVAWQAPHVTQHDRADITALEELRKRYSPRVEKAGGKLTITAILVKIAAGALGRFPQCNASADMAAEEIIYKKYFHIGIAVDTERGLLVPVIRDADRKTITDLSIEIAQLSEKARARKLTLEEMQGGSFSITNLGGIGGTAFTPIINWPEVAILGVSRANVEPIWMTRGAGGDRRGAAQPDGERGRSPAGIEDAGQFAPRLVLPLSLSYDHRVVDGADAARFLRFICEALENPLTLL